MARPLEPFPIFISNNAKLTLRYLYARPYDNQFRPGITLAICFDPVVVITSELVKGVLISTGNLNITSILSLTLTVSFPKRYYNLL